MTDLDDPILRLNQPRLDLMDVAAALEDSRRYWQRKARRKIERAADLIAEAQLSLMNDPPEAEDGEDAEGTDN